MVNCDMLSIINVATARRVNPAADIAIFRHVWVGMGVAVLKVSRIGANAIVAAHSVVRGEIPAGSIAAGIPVWAVRTGVTWDRRLLPICTA